MIDDLPEFKDSIKEPFYTEKQWEIAKLFLNGEAIENPHKDKLSSSVAKMIDVESYLSNRLSPSNLQTVINNLPLPDANLTASERNQIIASLNRLRTNIVPQINAASLKDLSTEYLTHTNELTNNIMPLTSSVNDILAMPNKLKTDIEGGLPSDFPGIPDFADGVPSFSGFSGVTSLPTLGVPNLNFINEMTSIADLEGVNLPGVPDPDKVLNSIATSVTLPEFGGIGSQVSDAFSYMVSGMENGLGYADQVVAAITGSTTAQLKSILNTQIPELNNMQNELEVMLPKLNELSAGVDNMIVGERTALYGCSCASTQGGGATVCNSPNSALGKAASIERAASYKSSAKIVKSLASEKLKSLLDL